MKFTNRTKYKVVRGTPFGLDREKQYLAGHALSFEGTTYYVLKLWFQLEKTYFISRNADGINSYTIYGRKVQDTNTEASFQNPIGYAREVPEKTHLEIVLPDLPKRYYMSLFPSK